MNVLANLSKIAVSTVELIQGKTCPSNPPYLQFRKMTVKEHAQGLFHNCTMCIDACKEIDKTELIPALENLQGLLQYNFLEVPKIPACTLCGDHPEKCHACKGEF